MNFRDKRYWLIGASEGLGRALAQKLTTQGAVVILSARNTDRLADLANTLERAEVVSLDVTDTVSVTTAIHQVGDVDGVIYCAGAYEPMDAANWNADKSVQVADVNFMGALRVLGRIVPKMIQNTTGHIVIIGSLAGHRGLPNAIGYGASKAALMHLAENMRSDTRNTGLRVQCINPGFIQTRLTQKNSFKMPMIMTAESAADRCMKAMHGRHFSTSFPAPFSWVFLTARLLPISWVHWVFQRKQ